MAMILCNRRLQCKAYVCERSYRSCELGLEHNFWCAPLFLLGTMLWFWRISLVTAHKESLPTHFDGFNSLYVSDIQVCAICVYQDFTYIMGPPFPLKF